MSLLKHLNNWPLSPIPFPQWGKGSSFYNTVWSHQTIIQIFSGKSVIIIIHSCIYYYLYNTRYNTRMAEIYSMIVVQIALVQRRSLSMARTNIMTSAGLPYIKNNILSSVINNMDTAAISMSIISRR